MRQQENSNEN